MKMLKLTYRNTRWSNNYETLTICSDEVTILINPVFIASVSPLAVLGHDGEKVENLYYVTTQIAYGRGINGVGYNGYYITEASYKNLVDNLEIIG